MWWHKRAAGASSGKLSSRTGVLVMPVLALGLALGACQVHPLYMADASVAGGLPMAEILRAVKVSGGSDELNFLFYGGGEPLPPKYYLRIIYTEQQTDLGIQQFSYVPQAELINGHASYTLTEVATNTVIAQGDSASTASYEIESQSFSNLHARKDASSRVQKTIAADLRLKVAAALTQFLKDNPGGPASAGAAGNGGGQGK